MMFYITQIFTILLYLQNLQIVESAKSKKKSNWYSIISKFSHQNGLPSSPFTASFWKVEIRHLSLLRGMHNRLSKNYFEIAMRYYTLRTQTSWIDLMMKLIKVQERSINCWNSASVQPSRGTPPTIKHGGSRWRSATCSRITILQFVRAGELPTMTRVSSSFLVFLNVATPFRRSCDRHYEFGHPIDFRCIREEHGVCRSVSLQTGVVRRSSEIHWASGIENSNFFSLKKIF